MQLHARIVEAKDIAKMDTFGKTDAYCQLGMNGKLVKSTKIIKNSMTPRWNEDFSFPVTNPQSDTFHLIMKDHDIALDDMMAVLDVSISSFPVGVVVDHWYPLQPAYKVKKGGLIHIIFHLVLPGGAAFVNQPAAPIPQRPLKLHLRLIEAKEIAKMDTIGYTDAYCVITINGNQQQRSTTQKNKQQPKWNQDFHFDIANPATDEIKILMRDEDVRNDDDMANWTMPIRYIPFCSLSDQWVTMEAVPKVKRGGRLHLLFHLAPPEHTPFIAQPPPAGTLPPQQLPGQPMQQQVLVQPQVPGQPLQQQVITTQPLQQQVVVQQQVPAQQVVQTIPQTIQQPQPVVVQTVQQPVPQMTVHQVTPAPMQSQLTIQTPIAPMQSQLTIQTPMQPAYGAPPVSGFAPPPPPSAYGAPPPPYGAPPASGFVPPPPPPAYGAPPPSYGGYQYGAPQSGYHLPPPTPGQAQGYPPQSGYGFPGYGPY